MSFAKVASWPAWAVVGFGITSRIEAPSLGAFAEGHGTRHRDHPQDRLQHAQMGERRRDPRHDRLPGASCTSPFQQALQVRQVTSNFRLIRTPNPVSDPEDARRLGHELRVSTVPCRPRVKRMGRRAVRTELRSETKATTVESTSIRRPMNRRPPGGRSEPNRRWRRQATGDRGLRPRRVLRDVRQHREDVGRGRSIRVVITTVAIPS